MVWLGESLVVWLEESLVVQGLGLGSGGSRGLWIRCHSGCGFASRTKRRFIRK